MNHVQKESGKVSVKYGQGRKITSNDINSVTYSNCSLLGSGNDESGSYFIKLQPDSGGCGSGTDSSFYVEIKDNPSWTKISYQLYLTGTAACWSFNSSGWTGNNNLLQFDSSIDKFYYGNNSFELPQFTYKVQACDNDSTNFWHGAFQVGTYRSFFITRRRDTSTTNLVKIALAWSCNSYGLGSYAILRNITVW